MANTIILKKSSTASAVPGAGSLQPGELAVNLADAKLYTKTTGGTVILVGSGAAGGGAGTVTSVDVSGGTTGLTTSGGPVTSSGTITLGGTLGVANGGTGATTLTSGYLLKGNGTSAVSASVVYDTGTNVGIGTASPGSKLNVDGGSLATSGAGILAAGSISTGRLISGGGATVNAIHTYYDDRAYELSAGSTSGYVSGVVVGARSYTGTGGDAVTLWTRSAERMRIDGAGSVGIGTSAPATLLDIAVNGGMARLAGASGNNLIQVSTGSGATGMGMWAGGNTRLYSTSGMILSVNSTLTTGAPTGYTDAMTINSSGNVGIGTASPGAKLHVVGGELRLQGSSSFYSFYDTAGTTRAGYIQNASGAIAVWGELAQPMTFATSNTERMRIDSSGNVGIGTTAPGYPFVVVANSSTQAVRLAGRAADGIATLEFTSNNQGTTQAYIQAGATFLFFGTGTTEQFRILSTGGITSASVADAVGYKGLPQNSQTASYTLALTDMGKMVNTTTGGVIIPANSSVAFPIGSTVVVYNNSASSQTISITTDTLYLAGTATTGSRTLAQRGLATCVKVASTTWVVSGNVT